MSLWNCLYTSLKNFLSCCNHFKSISKYPNSKTSDQKRMQHRPQFSVEFAQFLLQLHKIGIVGEIYAESTKFQEKEDLFAVDAFLEIHLNILMSYVTITITICIMFISILKRNIQKDTIRFICALLYSKWQMMAWSISIYSTGLVNNTTRFEIISRHLDTSKWIFMR